MKRIKNVVSLAIIAVLICLVMPADVFAAPPQGDTHLHNWVVISDTATCSSPGQITWKCTLCQETYSEASPATGVHTPVTVWGKAATCTEPGLSNGSKCSVCGAVLQKQTATPAKGHDWDDGVVTQEPEGFVPGVRTYTCRNDSSHTYTEAINPATNLFDLLRDIPHGGEEADPLVVTLEPIDGWITRGSGETHLFTIEVEGGVGSYTYEWHSRPVGGEEEETGGNPISYSVNDLCTHSADLFHSLGANWNSALTEMWKDTDKSSWLQSVEDTMVWDQHDEGLQALMESLDPTVKNYGSGNGPTYSAATGDRIYWCEITDETNDFVFTRDALVRYKLRIAVQPSNQNLYGKSEVTLSCEAADGFAETGYVTYTWYNGAGEEIGYGMTEAGEAIDFGAAEGEREIGFGGTIPVSEEGEYYCVVTDDVTTVYSEKCTVYSSDPFQIVDISEKDVQWEGDFGEVYATFTGGVKPYQFMWLYEGAEIETLYVTDNDEFVTAAAETDKAGTYTIVAVDAMGQRVYQTIERYNKWLSFRTDPEGGVASKLKPVYLTAELEETDVEFPVTYELIRNEMVYTARTLSRYTISFPVYYSGQYYIRATDAKGHIAETDFAAVTEPDFHIVSQSEDSHLTVQGEPVELFVEVEGGREPYKYQWIVYYGSLMHKFADTPSVRVYDVGTYGCRVLDADGKSVRAKVIKVDYTGGPPWIYRQPTTQLLPYNAEGNYEFIMTCAAKSGSGAYDGLDYQWYYADLVAAQSKNSNGLIQMNYVPEALGEEIGTGFNTVGTRLGLYGCKVTDQRNGESAYSDVGIADSVMEFVLEQTAPKRIYFTIKGGCPPYGVLVYADYKTSDGVQHFFYKDLTIENQKAATNASVVVDPNLRIKSAYVYGFSFEIIDAYGQVCTSDTIHLIS